MTDWPWSAWLFWIGGAGLGLTGLSLAVWALLADRSRGRRRCPKCWYDMSGLRGLRCPECGHSAKREKRLFRTRRRRRWAIAALILLLGAISGGLWPKARRDGWHSVVPTTFLVVSLNWLLDPASGQGSRLENRRLELRAELEDRTARDTLWEWQWSWLIRKCLEGNDEHAPPSLDWYRRYAPLLDVAAGHGHLDRPGLREEVLPVSVAYEITTRKRWPENLPLRVKTSALQWHGEGGAFVRAQPKMPGMIGFHDVVQSRGLISDVDMSYDGTIDVGVPPAGTDRLPFTVEFARNADWHGGYWTGGEVFGRHELVVPVEVGGSIDDVLAAWQSEEFDALLATRLKARLAGGYLTLWWQTERWFEIAQKPAVLALGLDVELLLDGNVVARGERFGAIDEPVFYTEVKLEGNTQMLMRTNLTEGSWTVRLRSNPELALRCFVCDTYWGGELTIPAELQYERDGDAPAIAYSSEELDRLLTKRLRARLDLRRPHQISLILEEDPANRVADWPGRTLFRVTGDVMADDKIVASFEGSIEIDHRGADGWLYEFGDLPYALTSSTVEESDWRLGLRPRGDTFLIPEQWRYYWDGEITIPLEIVGRSAP